MRRAQRTRARGSAEGASHRGRPNDTAPAGAAPVLGYADQRGAGAGDEHSGRGPAPRVRAYDHQSPRVARGAGGAATPGAPMDAGEAPAGRGPGHRAGGGQLHACTDHEGARREPMATCKSRPVAVLSGNMLGTARPGGGSPGGVSPGAQGPIGTPTGTRGARGRAGDELHSGIEVARRLRSVSRGLPQPQLALARLGPLRDQLADPGRRG